MIQRHHGFPVIALEVTVMQVVEITAGTGDPEVSLEDQLLETEMLLRRGERVVLGVHQHVDGMRGHDPVNQHTAEDNQVLNGMHGQKRNFRFPVSSHSALYLYWSPWDLRDQSQ